MTRTINRNLRPNSRVRKIARKLGPAIEDTLKKVEAALKEIRQENSSLSPSEGIALQFLRMMAAFTDTSSPELNKQVTPPATAFQATETNVLAVETDDFYCEKCYVFDWLACSCPENDISSTHKSCMPRRYGKILN